MSGTEKRKEAAWVMWCGKFDIGFLGMALTHQMTGDGDLLMTEVGVMMGECCCTADCPTDCSACGDYTLSFSGFGADTWGAEGCPCSDLNGSYSFIRISCTWEFPGLMAGCTGGSLFAEAFFSPLSCVSSVWTLTIDTIGPGATGVLAVFTAAAVAGGCPPNTGWTQISGNCSGGAMTLS